MNEKEQYIEYIQNHIMLVNYACKNVKHLLLDHLDFNIDDLTKRCLKHDKSKYSIEEFDAYRQYFYPRKDETPDENIFQLAWKHHYTNNDHHPEYFSYTGVVREMPDICIAEMFCDWIAMSMNFHNSVVDWYNENGKDKFNFHDRTYIKVNTIIQQPWMKDIHMIKEN